MKIVFSKKCLEYGSGHIEGPERVRRAYKILKEKNYDFLVPEPASEEDILRVHDADYVQRFKDGFVEDADTPAYEGIYEYARLSAGGAILAAEVNGFSLMRPPGHHAGRRGKALGVGTKGFCYLNNVAIATKHMNKPTLILDIDGHHGNGTQEIFLGDEKVMYVGLHRYPHYSRKVSDNRLQMGYFYPGTGGVSEANCLNFPLRVDCGDQVYLKTLDEALSKLDMDKFEVVAVSAGFDTHAGDLASLGLTQTGFREIGIRIASLNKPTFFVLEGGYSGENNGKDIDALLSAFEC